MFPRGGDTGDNYQPIGWLSVWRRRPGPPTLLTARLLSSWRALVPTIWPAPSC